MQKCEKCGQLIFGDGPCRACTVFGEKEYARWIADLKREMRETKGDALLVAGGILEANGLRG